MISYNLNRFFVKKEETMENDEIEGMIIML